MTNASKLSMFGDIYDVDMSVMQMESVASDLVFLLKHSGLNRSELANNLGWKKSRVTKVLSGDENLTIKTITSVAECLGYGFNIVFYNENYDQPKQPWTIDRENKKIIASKQIIEPKTFGFEVQTGDQVVSDVLAGNESDQYIKVTKFEKDSSTYFITRSDVQSLTTTVNSNKTFTYDLVNKVLDYEY